MTFNEHLKIKLNNEHAYMSASNYHWLNYTDQKFVETFRNHLAVEKGTKLHQFAAMAIEVGQKLPKTTQTLNMYVNDAIGYGMRPEQVLYYSENCFGTTDAISYKGNLLRIHDLKTGITPAKMEQLRIYAALFCLEYRMVPGEIDMELRIYQNNEVQIEKPDIDMIMPIMDKIVTFDKIIKDIKLKEGA